MATMFLAVLVAACGGGEDTGTTAWQGEGEACLSCHEGIEWAHEPLDQGVCTPCHGGDGTALTKEEAHVPVPDDYWEIRGDGKPDAPEGYIKDLAPDQLAQLDPDYVRFINPGDIRVLDRTCGVVGCHPEQSSTLPLSIMTTNAGHYMPTLFLGGYQDRTAIYGSHPAVDPDCDTSIEGAVCELTTLVPPGDDELDAALAAGDDEQLEELAYHHYLAKSCNTCHAAGYGKNNSPALYRSTGCTACHVVYGQDGVYEGGDQAIPHNVPVYPREHRITSAIPVEQCATCHFQGGRIGLLFRGIREGGFKDLPEHAQTWDEPVYGHAPGYYVIDEDTTNGIDETPPDLHYEAGMVCADCHVGTDVHGDGTLYSTSKQQVDIRCTDCHGTVRERATPDADGVYRTASGRPLPQLTTGGDGSVVLVGIMDGAEHVVPQPADILASGKASQRMIDNMAPDENGWSHTDDLDCQTCHTSYNQYCLGCHVSMDMRLAQTDQQSGLSSTGLVRGSREMWSLHNRLIGLGTSGKAQLVNPSQQVQMAVIDRDGVVQVGTEVLDEDGNPTGEIIGEFRESGPRNLNIGFAPFFQHTTTRSPPPCSTCHRVDDSEEEWARVKGVYGYGTGEFLLENEDGSLVDPLQFLDEDGNPVTTWVHEGTGPLPPERRDRALSVVVPK